MNNESTNPELNFQIKYTNEAKMKKDGITYNSKQLEFP